MTPKLVIFDCDGVLVDSEPIALRVLVDGLAESGVQIDLAEAQQRFLGRSLGAVCEVVRAEHGVTITDDTLIEMRAELYERFRQELKPIPGVASMLEDLQKPVCVASSSQPERIQLALQVTGLLDSFAPHIFSASMVERGKPAPDLFLYAAVRMGVEPECALVIEDSTAGVEAAHRAGMRVFGFTGGSHVVGTAHDQGLRAAGADLIFDDMGSLPERICGPAA